MSLQATSPFSFLEQLPAANIGLLLQQRAEQYGDKPFLLFPEKEQTLSYQALSYQTLFTRCCQTAHLLQALGVGHNHKVALLLPNIPEFVLFYWGTMMLGAVAGPTNTLLKAPEIQFIVDNCEATVLVTTPEFAAELNAITDQLPLLKHVVVVEDVTESPAEDPAEATADFALKQPLTHFEAVINGYPNTLPEITASVSSQDEAMIIYTSGTTGKPKGVLLTHQNLMIDAVFIRDWFKLTPETRMMCILPLFHVNGEVVTLMTPLVTGASVVLNRKFSAITFWPYVERFGVNVFSTVPTILSILLAKGASGLDRSTLQFGICGAAPLPVEVHKQFEATFNVPIYEGYGLSETTCYSTFNPPDIHKRKIGSIGQAVGNQVAIWDEAGNPQPPEAEGEIVIQGPNVMRGYFKRPEANKEAFKGGWFHSGDWGKQDADGFFYILDRVKDMIIRGGENIYPREIDEVLYQHPAIEAAATIGIPDPKYGEEVKSYVVLKPGHSLTEDDILAYCKERMADFKCPKFVAFIDEIPKGPTGKLLRRVLREMG